MAETVTRSFPRNGVLSPGQWTPVCQSMPAIESKSTKLACALSGIELPGMDALQGAHLRPNGNGLSQPLESVPAVARGSLGGLSAMADGQAESVGPAWASFRLSAPRPAEQGGDLEKRRLFRRLAVPLERCRAIRLTRTATDPSGEGYESSVGHRDRNCFS